MSLPAVELDIPTLLITLTITTSVFAIAVLIVAARAKIHQGLATWGIGLMANALSYPAFGLRAFGWTVTSIITTNLLTALGFALLIKALASFHGQYASKPNRNRFVWFLVGLNVCCAGLLIGNDQLRNVVVAGIQTLLAFLLLCQAGAPELREDRLTGQWIVVTGATLLVVTLAVRTYFMACDFGSGGPYNVPLHVQSATYLAVLTVVQLNSIGFVLMQMEHAVAQQQRQATRDGLTGVLNRRALIDALKHVGALARRNEEPMATLMIDIDHFKAINDRHGHLVGDDVLREVARRTEKRLRQSDILARYGGEEFVVVLPDTGADGALTVAESIRRELEQTPCRLEGLSVPVTVSIGGHAGIPDSSDADARSLIAASDKALYQAKSDGRNRVVVI